MRRADHLHVLIVSKSGSLNLLEPSGPVQACAGIPLPLPLPLTLIYIFKNKNYFKKDKEKYQSLSIPKVSSVKTQLIYSKLKW